MARPASPSEALGMALIDAGIPFPLTHPTRWQSFLRGEDVVPLKDLDLDNFDRSALSMSLRRRTKLNLSEQDLIRISSLRELLGQVRPIWQKRGLRGSVSRALGTMRVWRDSLSLKAVDAVSSATPNQLRPWAWLPETQRVRAIRRIHEVLRAVRPFGPTVLEWRRKALSKEVLCYSRAIHLEDARTLLVFGGSARLPMMPVGMFLAGVQEHCSRVILVRSRRNSAFQDGIVGLAPTLEGAFERLSGLLKREFGGNFGEKGTLLVGVSAGGLPALIFCDYLPLKHVLLIGPHATDDPRWRNSEALARALEHRRRADTQIVIAYGGNSKDQLKVASWTRDIHNMRVEKVKGAGHNVLHLMFREHRLGDFLVGKLGH